MDRAGHDKIRETAADAGNYHVEPMDPRQFLSRYVSVQVTGQNPEGLLNALDDAGLMAREEGPHEAIYVEGPQLQVIASSGDWLTFEDMNDRR